MENKDITIFCVNDGEKHRVPVGGTLQEISSKHCKCVTDPKTGEKFEVIAALVDNKLKELSYKPMVFHQVEFIGYNHPDGRRTYIRSLCFVLQNAIRELYPDKVLVIDHPLPSGLYCEIRESVKMEDGRRKIYFATDEELEAVRGKMREIVRKDLPFTKEKLLSTEAQQIFLANHQPAKAELQMSLGTFTCSVYYLDGRADTFHGPLIPSTRFLKVFEIIGFGNGFCLQPPSLSDFNKVMPLKRQSKISAALKEYSDWCSIIGINGLGTLNRAIMDGKAIDIINLSEAQHEKRYSQIAEIIYANRSEKRIVMIAGPSSSGKTTSSLRLALQCRGLGLKPKVIELDNYFVNREKTPRDEDGNYDFECLEAMDLDFLNQQLNELLEGKEVEIPIFDFKNGCRTFTGNYLKLEEKDILILEGIHALNPEMTSAVDNTRIFRVYASALTSLNIDENNNMSTSDSRLLRRMVRDNRTRGIIPEETIVRWNSVRRGENQNIFPFQENADALFNSALIFEIPLLKYYAEPLLLRIAPNSPAYTEAVRLLKFLNYVIALQPSEIAAIPPTSIMREFIGGQTL